MFKYLYVIAILLFSTIAVADNRVVGHITPLPEELLEQPITLDCGATIREARGGSFDWSKLNSLCTHAISNFFIFIEYKGLKTKHKNHFNWNIAFLPDTRAYRGINDENYRFRYRFVKGDLVGYTDLYSEYTFVFSKTYHFEFKVTFVHELFHAMSMFYGVYENHAGGWGEKTARDEVLAQEFTQWLGYGK